MSRDRTGMFGTFGYLSLDLKDDGSLQHLCSTLEPATCDGTYLQGLKYGTYKMKITYSPKFKRNLPLLSVDGREGIRIHSGNTFYDTTGCILVGLYATKSELRYSRIALNFVIDVIKSLKIDTIIIQPSLLLNPNFE